MKFHLNSLRLLLKRGEATLPFSSVSYFWGQMGAGKTTIARLIDYCLGGDFELSPAMQSEFVSATLSLDLEKGKLTIERARESDRVVAQWGKGDEAFHVALPARSAAGEVIPGTGVEVLSDLIFWLSGISPPRVRKSKTKQDAETARLSIRDLFWYCYLDQDEIDSSFFNLDEGGNAFKRLKSRDVLRYVIGYHNEHVAEIEAELDELRGKRQATASSVESLSRVLKEMGVETELEILARARDLREKADTVQQEIISAKQQPRGEQTQHAADFLRTEAIQLSTKLSEIDAAISDLRRVREQDLRHLNEIETLSLKHRRSASARTVLSGVAFESCPRCVQVLPSREAVCCNVCGQIENFDSAEEDAALVERDVKQRASELRELLSKQELATSRLLRERDTVSSRKTRIERERNEASSRYDTAFLSAMLSKERERASLLQDVENLTSMVRFPQMLETLRNKIGDIAGREAVLRSALKEARSAAESDSANLTTLKELFLDCLIRSGVPGITTKDIVEISLTTFLPEIYAPGDEFNVTSFANLSSGGKKTLFKCCFAIAVHRLAMAVNAPLPSLLIIDSPMKNISERENREQFQGFYDMLYQLKATELNDTQLILIDKEFSTPAAKLNIAITERHMRPNDPENPPLIPYYQGK